MKLLSPLGFLCALLSPLTAAEVSGPLTLVNQTGFNRFTVRIGAAGVFDTENPTATGTMNVKLNVNPSTGKVSQLSFEGGNVALSNMNFSIGLFFVPSAYVNLITTGVSGQPSTPNPPAPVTTSTGEFDAALHEFTINQGAITGVALGTPLNENFSTTPVTGPGQGTGTITLTEVPGLATATTRTWTTVVVLPLDFTDTQDLDGTQVTVDVSGTLKASGNLVIPKTNYLAWVAQYSLGAPVFGSPIRHGEPHGMVWAMGLTPSASIHQYLPRIITGGPSPIALMEFPAGGTAGPLLVEVSHSLAPGSWVPALATDLSVGANPIPAGTPGVVTVDLNGGNRFVRLRANEE
jgi:hypothetical protein